jgi:ABC-2 type transport system ATP-binding protein
MAILGTPKINLWLTPSQKEFQVNVFFYDVGPLGGTELIGHATYTEKDATPGRAQLVSPQTDVISHKISSGHTLRVIIATSDIAYALPLLPVFTLDINHDAQHKSSISLPVL